MFHLHASPVLLSFSLCILPQNTRQNILSILIFSRNSYKNHIRKWQKQSSPPHLPPPLLFFFSYCFSNVILPLGMYQLKSQKGYFSTPSPITCSCWANLIWNKQNGNVMCNSLVLMLNFIWSEFFDLGTSNLNCNTKMQDCLCFYFCKLKQ